jgi:hypothetical protein
VHSTADPVCQSPPPPIWIKLQCLTCRSFAVCCTCRSLCEGIQCQSAPGFGHSQQLTCCGSMLSGVLEHAMSDVAGVGGRPASQRTAQGVVLGLRRNPLGCPL